MQKSRKIKKYEILIILIGFLYNSIIAAGFLIYAKQALEKMKLLGFKTLEEYFEYLNYMKLKGYIY